MITKSALVFAIFAALVIRPASAAAVSKYQGQPSKYASLETLQDPPANWSSTYLPSLAPFNSSVETYQSSYDYFVPLDTNSTHNNMTDCKPSPGPAVCETTLGSPMVSDVQLGISYYQSDWARGKVCCQRNDFKSHCTTINRFESTAAVAMCGQPRSGQVWDQCVPCPSIAMYLQDLVNKCSWEGRVGGWKQMGCQMERLRIVLFHR